MKHVAELAEIGGQWQSQCDTYFWWKNIIFFSMEIRCHNHRFNMHSLFWLPFFVSEKLCLLTLTTAAVFFYAEDESDKLMLPQNIYAIVGMFQVLRLSLTVFLPFTLAGIAELNITFQRIMVRRLLFLNMQCYRHFFFPGRV